MPIKHIAGAKALAQHIDQNGQAWDTQGETIMHMIQVLQQCRRLRNWLNQNDQTLVPHMDIMQAKIKHGLKQISDANHYEVALQEATQMCEAWRAQPEQHAHVPEQMQEAWHALMCETATNAEPDHMNMEDPIPQHEDEWPEHRELMEWFNQFGSIMESDSSDIKRAVKATNSDNPRDILSYLSDNITGWEDRFKKDPKQALDQIRDTLKKLKKVG
jgi:hypothetical protein